MEENTIKYDSFLKRNITYIAIGNSIGGSKFFTKAFQVKYSEGAALKPSFSKSIILFISL